MKTIIKMLILLPLITLAGRKVQAQFLGGFFSQQTQQRKVMAEQIAQYQIYLSALKTGYHITESGLNTAHELKNGTFNLHNAYFNSLEQVNPVIQNNSKGRTIADLDQQTQKLLTDEISWEQQKKILTVAEISYLQKVKTNLAGKCRQDMDELLQVLTPGKLQLTDAQRLARLDKLYDSMKDKFSFAGSFTAKCRKLALGREQNRQDNDQLKKLYGIQ
jgi:hypothetical protein